MTQDSALTLHAQLDTDGVKANSKDEICAVFKIDPVGQPIEGHRQTLSVVFALDVSGSMGGPPLEHVIESVGKLVELLDPTDKVGVVAFSSGATEVAPLLALTPSNRRSLLRRVGRLQADGGTSIEAGLRLSADMMPPRREGERQVVLLLSDGAPNIGISDGDGLATIAASMRPDVSIATLGFGPHHNEDMLDTIAKAGSGEYAFIAAPLECGYEFSRALGAQGDVVADGIELVLRPEEGVEIAELLSPQRTRFGAAGLTVMIPDAMVGRPQYVIVRLALSAPRERGPWDIMAAQLRYRVAGQMRQRRLDLSVVAVVRGQRGAPIKEASGRVLLARAEAARRESRAMADRGHFEGAAAVLRKIIAAIQATPGFTADDGSDLSEAVEQLLDEVMAYERKPAQEEYRAFRRVALNMNMQAGGVHGSDHVLGTPKAQQLTVAAMGVGLPTAQLIALKGPLAGQRFPLGPENNIGRTRGNHICIPRASVSKRQVRIIGHNGHFIAIDLKSTNGSYVNGQKITSPAILKVGDRLCVGDALFEYTEL